MKPAFSLCPQVRGVALLALALGVTWGQAQEALPELRTAEQVRRLTAEQVTPGQLRFLDELFEHEIAPVLTPLAVEGEEVGHWGSWCGRRVEQLGEANRVD